MQKFLRTLMLVALMLVPFASRAQVTTFPYSCDFEDATEAAAWTFVNGELTNQWVLGTAANNTTSGSYGIYISNDAGTSAAYTVSSAAVAYAYREFYLTPGEYTVTFDWQCNGESTWDYLLAALVDASVTLTAGTSLPSGVSYSAMTASGWTNLGPTSPNLKMNLSTTWNTQTATFTVTTAGTYRIVFVWRNDTSGGTAPGACVDNVVVTQNSCPTPSGLLVNNITTSSMDLTWTEIGAATSWLVYVNGEYDGTANSTSYSLTGLNGNTVYTIAVRSFCGAGDTSNAVTGTVRTACPESVALPYVEEFNGYSGFQSYPYTGPSISPACWGYYSNGTNTAATTTSAYYGGVYQATSTSYGSHEANNPYLCMPIYVVGSSASSTYTGYRNARGDVKYAIMPPLATAISGLQIGFDYKISTSNSSTGANTTLEFGYTTGDDTSTFVSMWSAASTSTTIQHVVDMNLSTLAAAAPTGARLAFKFHGTHNGTSTSSSTAVYCGIDNIVVENLPSCARVTNLTVTAVTNNSITLSWLDTINTGATYTVYNGSEVVATGINAMTYTVTGLTGNTDYTFNVVTNCSATDNSAETTVIAHTDCDAMTTLPYLQTFEAEATGSSTSAAFAECWNRLNNGTQYFGHPYIGGSSYNHTDGGSKGLYWYNYATTATTYGDYQCIVLPSLGGNYSVSDCRLKFWAKASSTSYHPELYVGVLTNAHDINSFVVVDTVNVEGTTWTEYTVNLNGYTGNGSFVAIRANRPASTWYAYVDDILLEEMPSCVEISELAAGTITTSSVTLTWTDVDNTNATYTVYNMADNSVVATGISATTYTVTGLATNTAYTFGVVANCSATEASQIITVSTRTACDANTVFPWNDDFESYSASSSGVTLNADCWINEHISGSGSSLFQVYSSTSTSGMSGNTTKMLRLPDMSNGTMTKLVLPAMSFPTGSSYRFSIDVLRNTTSYASEGVRVFASTNGEIEGATELGFLYRNYTQTDNGVVTAETASGWYTYDFIIPFTGTCYIILRGENQYGSATYMDNFVIAEAPSCLSVSNLTVSGITTNSVTMTWVDTLNTGATYTVSDADGVIATGITGTTYTVTGLTAETNYTFSVVANCSANDASQPVSVSAFTGYCQPNPTSRDGQGITSVTIGNMTNSDTHPTASPFYGNYANMVASVPAGTNANVEIIYGHQYSYGTIIWVDWNNNLVFEGNEVVYAGESAGGSNPHTLTGSFFIPATQATGSYRMRIAGADSYFDDYIGSIADAANANPCFTSTYAGVEDYTLSVTTIPTCISVSNLTAEPASTSVTLSWTDSINTGATYTVYNGSEVVATGINGTTYTVTGLTGLTDYTFSVVANCSADDASLAVSVNVRTLMEPIMCGTEEALTYVNVDTTNSNTSYYPAYSLYNYSYSEVIVPASRLTGLGEIKAMQFNVVNTASGSSNLSNCEVYMMNTTATSLANGFIQDSNNFQLVFSGSLNHEETGLVTLVFQNNFTWNGTDNLLVAVRRNTGSWASSPSFAACTGTDTLARHIYTDESAYTIGAITGGTPATTVPVYNFIGCPAQPADPCVVGVTLPFTEGFEDNSATLSCWTQDGPGTWNFGTGDYSESTGSYQGSANAKITHATNGNVTKLISPAINGATNGIQLIFAHVQRSWAGDIDELRIYTRASATADWQVQATYTDAYASWTNEILNISTPVYQVAFEMTDNYGYGIGIDNVIINLPPSCMPVTNLAASNITAHTATLTWTGDATSYNVYNMSDTSLVQTVTDTAIALSGLSGQTAYTFGVASNCGNDESMIMTVSFTTLISCPAPTGLSVTLTPGNGTVATLNWIPGGEETAWQVCLNEDMTNLIDVYDTTLSLTNLTAEQAYTAKVRAICAADDQSAWSNTITFTPTNAYVLTVNDGTNTNSYVPIYGLWVDDITQSQFVIPATDLTALQYGNITKLSFYASQENVNWGAATFNVYMTETTETGVSTLADYTAMTQVYAGTLSIVNNVMEVNFTTPFTYLGGNLMIGFQQTVSGTYSSSSWYGVNTTGASMGGYGSNISQRNFLPKTTINFTPGTAPSCMPVSNLTVDSVSATSVSLSWTDNDNTGVTYTVYNMADTSVVATNIANTNYTVTGLTASTAYTFGVVANCSATESSIFRTITATTDCAGGSCLITINATDEYGDGWNGNTITISQNGATVATYTMASQNLSSTVIYDTFQVSVCSGVPVTFTWTSGNYAYEVGFEIINGGNAVVYSINDASSLTNGDVILTMNDACPSCIAPSITVDSTSNSSISISWTSDASNFNVYMNNAFVANVTTNNYTFTGLTTSTVYSLGVQAICSATDSSDIATVNVATACGTYAVPFVEDFENEGSLGCWTVFATSNNTGFYSDDSYVYSGNNGFVFGYSTNPPQYLISPELTGTGDGVTMDFSYRIMSSTYPESFQIGYSTTTNDTSAFIWGTEVIDSTTLTYERYVETLEATGIKYVAIKYTAYDAYYLFIDSLVVNAISAGCDPVTDLTVADVTTSTVSISWNGTASSYDLYNGTTFVANVETTNYTFTDLTAATEYTFGVVALCSETEQADMVTVNATTETEIVPDTFAVTIAVNNAEMGTTDPEPGVYYYVSGSTVTISALPAENYRFVAWSNGMTDEVITITVVEDIELTAEFDLAIGIDDVDNVDINVYGKDGDIVLQGAEGYEVFVFDATGRMMHHTATAALTERYNVPASGMYLVRVVGIATKRVVIVR